MNWVQIKQKSIVNGVEITEIVLPSPGRTVLAAHVEDINPVVCFCTYTEEDLTINVYWMRQLEGPEDGEHQTYEPLFRDPTHWKELDPLPIEEL